MYKYSLVSLLLILLAQQDIYAQKGISYGIKAGPVLSKFSKGRSSKFISSRLDYSLGVLLNFQLTPSISIGSEFSYSRKGAVEGQDKTELVITRTMFLEAPLLLRYHFDFLNISPEAVTSRTHGFLTFGVYFSHKIDESNQRTDYVITRIVKSNTDDIYFSDRDVGFVLGVGATFGKTSLKPVFEARLFRGLINTTLQEYKELWGVGKTVGIVFSLGLQI